MQKLLTTFLCLALVAGVSAQSEWKYLPNAPVGGRFDDVFFLNSQLGWAVNASGRMYKTTDGGLSWNNVFNTTGYFRCVEFFNANIGYAGTLDSKFLRTTDGGNTWKNLAPDIVPSPKAVCGISIPDSLVAYAVGQWDEPAFVLKTTNGGVSWQRQNMSQHAKALVDVFFMNRDTGFVTGKSTAGKAIILYTTNGGQSWEKKYEDSANGQYVWKIQRITPNNWVGSVQTFGGGRMVKSSDGGMSWTALTAPIADMQGIGFATPELGWVGGYQNGFFETTDGGSNWTFKDFGGNFNRFYFLSPGLAFASGNSIYKFSDPTSGTDSPASGQKGSSDDGFEISLSPNPSSGILNVKFKLPVRDNLRMSIYRPDGAEVLHIYHERQLAVGEHQFQADCSTLPAGRYFIGIQRNHGLYAKPFVKN